MLLAVKIKVPLPSWFNDPAPEMTLVMVTALLWLKLMRPLPAPKAARYVQRIVAVAEAAGAAEPPRYGLQGGGG